MSTRYQILCDKYDELVKKNYDLLKENRKLKDYDELLVKNYALQKEKREEIRKSKYMENLIKRQREHIKEVHNKLSEKDEEIKKRDLEIERLKVLLNMDGTNHGIPTSMTPINKKKIIPNTREKTDKLRGGQVGHKKHKLEKLKREEITEEIEHTMEECPHCKSEDIKTTGEIKEKDEIDYRIVVEKKRHKFIEYKCAKCGKEFHQRIPNNIKEENQYGAQVQALELTLLNQANVTINKAQKMTYGMTNGEIDLSEGYIAKLQKRAAKGLDNFMNELKQEIMNAPILHWDDTVIMVNTQRSCLRFYGNEKIAMYTAHLHKNKEGLDEDGILKILPKETILVHDHNKVNYNKEYSFTNAECNRHLIADLNGIIQNTKHKWARKLKDLLNSMNNKRKRLIEKGKEEFDQEELNRFERKYEEIMLLANEEYEEDKDEKYLGNERTVIMRLLDYKNEYFLWIYNFDVPFTNNLSERGLRGVKSKQKASGQFWNIKTGSYYATIRSYIETCNRNGVNAYNALLQLCLGEPYSLKDILSGKLAETE